MDRKAWRRMSRAGTPNSKTKKPFDIVQYWDHRYSGGRDSGDGSRGSHAKRKADILIDLIKAENLKTVYDLGCGDMFILNAESQI